MTVREIGVRPFRQGRRIEGGINKRASQADDGDFGLVQILAATASGEPSPERPISPCRMSIAARRVAIRWSMPLRRRPGNPRPQAISPAKARSTAIATSRSRTAKSPNASSRRGCDRRWRRLSARFRLQGPQAGRSRGGVQKSGGDLAGVRSVSIDVGVGSKAVGRDCSGSVSAAMSATARKSVSSSRSA